jgi:hypothetical protein
MHAAKERYWQLGRDARGPDFDVWLRRLQAGDHDAVEPMLVWLEDDHFCWRSGYAKQRVMRLLPRARPDDAQADRIRQLLIDLCGRGRRQEWRDTVRLARHVATPRFAAELDRVVAEADRAEVAERAQSLADACRRAIVGAK